jgi:hypothetical protein
MGKNKGKVNSQQRNLVSNKKSKNVHNRYKKHDSINNDIRCDNILFITTYDLYLNKFTNSEENFFDRREIDMIDSDHKGLDLLCSFDSLNHFSKSLLIYLIINNFIYKGNNIPMPLGMWVSFILIKQFFIHILINYFLICVGF